MATFTYRALSVGGGSESATIEAPDRASALRELRARGRTPIAIEEATTRGRAAARAGGRGGRGAMSRAEMATFVRELSTALRAGLSLVPALRTIARQGRSQRQRAMLEHLIERVEGGSTLADAAADWGRPFSELTVNLIRAGESSGQLGEVLLHSGELLERDVKLRRSMLAATLYPMILGVMITIAVVVVVTVIVPRVLRAVAAAGGVASLPWPTRVVDGVASFFSGYWWIIVPAIGAAVWGMGRVYAMPAARLAIDRWLLGVPVLGQMLRDVAVARFTRTLGTLTGAGIPVLSALRVTKATLGNRAMEGVIDDVCEQVAAGRTIADPMEQSGYFPPMLVQIVNMGERSGKLDEMLRDAASAFEERTESSVKLFTTALPPLLVVIMAVVVGFVVLSILLPLINLQESLQ